MRERIERIFTSMSGRMEKAYACAAEYMGFTSACVCGAVEVKS